MPPIVIEPQYPYVSPIVIEPWIEDLLFLFSIQIGLEKNFERRCYPALDDADSNKKAEEYFLKPSDTVLDILYYETWHYETWHEGTWYEDT